MSDKFQQAIAAINLANNKDPNIEIDQTKEWPKELLYSRRMSEMLQRYKPAVDEAVKLAVSAQHIQRWKSPRSDYPMDKKGYYQWRTSLYKYHANTVGKILEVVGYDATFIERVKRAVGKKSIRTNADTQALEDVAALVFIEHYMLAFANKHPEYSEEKWLVIIKRTWHKMSDDAKQFATSGKLVLPKSLITLIKKAIAN